MRKESGVFVAVVMVGGEKYNAAVYADRRNKVFEAHLLDFNSDCTERNSSNYSRKSAKTCGLKVRRRPRRDRERRRKPANTLDALMFAG